MMQRRKASEWQQKETFRITERQVSDCFTIMALTSLQQQLGPHFQTGTGWVHLAFPAEPKPTSHSSAPLSHCALHPQTHASSNPYKIFHPRTRSPEYNSLIAWLEEAGSELFCTICRCSYVLIRKMHAYFCPAEAHADENHPIVHLFYSQETEAGWTTFSSEGLASILTM